MLVPGFSPARNGLQTRARNLDAGAGVPAGPEAPRLHELRGRFRHGELIEVTEDDASLTWFPGDLLCKACVLECGEIS